MGVVLLAGLILLVGSGTGCDRKKTVQDEAAKLEKAFTPPAPDAPADPVQARIQEALTALRANDHGAALTILEALRRRPGLTAEQRMAVNDAAGQLERALIQRALAGDQQAKATLDRLRRDMDRR